MSASSVIIMLRLLLFVFCPLVVLFVTAVFILWRKISRHLKERRNRELVRLSHYHNRLRLVVNALFAQADDIDQQSKYLGWPTEAEWSRRLAKVCSNLVILGDGLTAIEAHLKSGDLGASRSHLLQSCRIATTLMRQLQEIRGATRLLGVGQDLRYEPQKTSDA